MPFKTFAQPPRNTVLPARPAQKVRLVFLVSWASKAKEAVVVGPVPKGPQDIRYSYLDILQ